MLLQGKKMKNIRTGHVKNELLKNIPGISICPSKERRKLHMLLQPLGLGIISEDKARNITVNKSRAKLLRGKIENNRLDK